MMFKDKMARMLLSTQRYIPDVQEVCANFRTWTSEMGYFFERNGTLPLN